MSNNDRILSAALAFLALMVGKARYHAWKTEGSVVVLKVAQEEVRAVQNNLSA